MAIYMIQMLHIAFTHCCNNFISPLNITYYIYQRYTIQLYILKVIWYWRFLQFPFIVFFFLNIYKLQFITMSSIYGCDETLKAIFSSFSKLRLFGKLLLIYIMGSSNFFVNRTTKMFSFWILIYKSLANSSDTYHKFSTQKV